MLFFQKLLVYKSNGKCYLERSEEKFEKHLNAKSNFRKLSTPKSWHKKRLLNDQEV